MDEKEPISPAEPERLESMIVRRQTQDAIRLRICNNNQGPSYVTLLSPTWKKDNVTVDIPIMKDPTIGRLEEYSDLCQWMTGKKVFVNCIEMWCPALIQNLDLFTLHIYDETPEKDNPHAFSNLIICRSIFDAYQMRTDIIWTEKRIALVDTSRIALIVPAHSLMVMDLYYDKVEDALPTLPI